MNTTTIITTQDIQGTQVAQHTQDTKDTIHVADLFARLGLTLIDNGTSYTGRHRK